MQNLNSNFIASFELILENYLKPLSLRIMFDREKNSRIYSYVTGHKA